jgi:hypothetical protein
MNEDEGAPEQGFGGDIVEHDNMKTATKDWSAEYGRHQQGYKEICALYPNNRWCRDRGYHQTTPAPKSAGVRALSSLLLALPIVVVHGYLS